MQCPRCQHENRPDAKFCDECGTPLKHSSASTQPAPSYADVQSSLAESLTQQTATSEILGVISRSQTDVHPVFETIAANALRLCGAKFSLICMYDGELIHIAVLHNVSPEDAAAMRDAFPMPPGRGGATARAVLTRSIVHIPDVLADPEYRLRRVAETTNARNALSVPLLRDGEPIGALTVGGDAARPFSERQIALLKTFADQAVIAIENVRLFKELEARNRDLTTALDRQTATADVLRIIARSPTELQPVLEAIAESAVRLCEASDAVIERLEGDRFYNAAHAGNQMKGLVGLPLPLTRRFPGGRAVLDRRRVIIDDIHLVAEREYPDTLELLKLNTIHSVAEIPLLSEGKPLGTIAVLRAEVRPFTDAEVTLLETFADQAVIAIENVRLFKELEARNKDLTEALDQQTATSEILRVISQSPTNVQPVFDTIAARAKRLCDARECAVFRFDGELIHLVAQADTSAAWSNALRGAYPRPPGRGMITARAIQAGSLVHVPDVLADPEFELTEAARVSSVRSTLSVPMIREGQVIGAITVVRREPKPFLDKQIGLVRIFADQAVIAIENVRLFKELEGKNRDLTTALDQLTATSDILRVISRSPTDVQSVFDTIARSTVRLCEAARCAVWRPEGDLFRCVARYASEGHIVSVSPRDVLEADSLPGKAIRERQILQINDVPNNPAVPPKYRELARIGGYRSLMAVPMVRGEVVLGVITVARPTSAEFSDQQIGLVRTFADQAVIAIENVRLFTELQEKNQALTQAHAQVTEALEQQTATAQILRVISQSQRDIQPVFETIVRNAVRLCGAVQGGVYRFDGELVHSVAHDGYTPEQLRQWQATWPKPVSAPSVTCQAIRTQGPIRIRDFEAVSEFHSPETRANMRFRGSRSILAVPMFRQNTVMGAISLAHRDVDAFSDAHLELLKTFADQAVIAIENARLFREIEDKSRQLEVASQHKSEFLANMSHELRTPLNAIIGFSEVLSDRMFGDLNEKQEEYLKDIYASGTHLLSLINDILDLSKIEAGRMELELTDFHLPTALDNALTLVRERAGRRSIALQMSVDERLGEVRADERKIRQVVLNLLSNAIKFTSEGGRIEVRAVPVDGSVEVSVSDTGVGIAPEDQEAVFEEFRQVGTSAAKQEGTGLGLTLCRKFVELHGGKIRVQSEVGAGSTFTFTIPVRRGE